MHRVTLTTVHDNTCVPVPFYWNGSLSSALVFCRAQGGRLPCRCRWVPPAGDQIQWGSLSQSTWAGHHQEWRFFHDHESVKFIVQRISQSTRAQVQYCSNLACT